MPKTSSKGSKSSDGGDAGGDDKFKLSNNRFISVSSFRGRLKVDIREYYVNDKGERLPGKKGISLSLDEWKKLKDYVDDVDGALKKLDSDASESDDE